VTPLRIEDFDYQLPVAQIAQHPLAERAASRLLLLERGKHSWEDRRFRQLPEILRGDELLVVNNARVLPARLFGRRLGARAQAASRKSRMPGELLKAQIEVLLTREIRPGEWEALVRPGRKMQLGERVVFGSGELGAEVIGRGDFGQRRLRFTAAGNLHQLIESLGHMPLPPYIRRLDEESDRERYQTIFAREPGAVAAPTAALHFDAAMLAELRSRGHEISELTLHVGLGTFQPIRAGDIEAHRMHQEAYRIPEETAERIRLARREGRPVVAVGTTVVRALEDAAHKHSGEVRGGEGEAEIFIRPGHTFCVVDQCLTNFHLPHSTLLVLVAAFAGREFVLEAYRHAVAAGYRFYSYGDCMLIR